MGLKYHENYFTFSFEYFYDTNSFFYLYTSLLYYILLLNKHVNPR